MIFGEAECRSNGLHVLNDVTFRLRVVVLDCGKACNVPADRVAQAGDEIASIDDNAHLWIGGNAAQDLRRAVLEGIVAIAVLAPIARSFSSKTHRPTRSSS
jgi:hypothetical protein